MSEPIVPELWNNEVEKGVYEHCPIVHQEHILKQYEICIEMADRISARRNLANTFFLTLHTFIVGAVGFAYNKVDISVSKWLVLLPLSAVLALCFSWWRLIESYRQLNTAKFRVIGEFERKLPAGPYWFAEWKALGEGKDPRLHKTLAGIENRVPAIFGFLYVMAAIIFLMSK